mgnify:CR=1 FL=1
MSFTNFGDLANAKNQSIIFVHVPTGKMVTFPGFLTQYSDQYSVQWGNEQIYGRNDPIKPYQFTTRNMQVGFDVLSPDIESAKDNLAKMALLTKMLYPVYTAPMNAQNTSLGRTIKAPPLIRIKFVNMIQSADGNGSLLGCVEGFTYEPNKDPGYFVERNGDIFPKHFNISFRFTPQHESPLGWGAEDKEFLTDKFPYSAERTPAAENSQGANPSVEGAKQDRILGYRV